jgi:hypothetical protein
MKLYILFADEDTGASEDWTVFKTGAEAFDSAEKRAERKQWILDNYSGDNPSEVDFYEYEIDLNPGPRMARMRVRRGARRSNSRRLTSSRCWG